MDFGLLYQKMFNSMKIGGIQTIINSAYEVLKLPIVVVDTSYNVLASIGTDHETDEEWDAMVTDKQVSDEIVWSFFRDKYIESVCSSTKPVYLNWGSLKIPRISGSIRVNGIIRGYTGVLCLESEFTDELIEATQIVTDAIALDMTNHKNENTQNDPLLELFTRELLNSTYINEKQLETWKINFKDIFKGDYMLVAVSPPSGGVSGLMQYFSTIITSKYPNVLSTILSDTLFLFFYNVQSDLRIKEIVEGIGKKISSFNTHYSSSKKFSNILDVPNYRFQLEKALEVGPKLHPQRSLHYFEDYIISTVFSYPLKEMNPMSYIHPIIYELDAFDKKNHTDYLITLETYILCICNSRVVAERLHIHRNTLLYRLNKIEEITNCNLDDEDLCTKLMISFQMIKLEKQLDKPS